MNLGTGKTKFRFTWKQIKKPLSLSSAAQQLLIKTEEICQTAELLPCTAQSMPFSMLLNNWVISEGGEGTGAQRLLSFLGMACGVVRRGVAAHRRDATGMGGQPAPTAAATGQGTKKYGELRVYG